MIELRSLSKGVKLNADGSANMTLSVSFKGFSDEVDLDNAYQAIEYGAVKFLLNELGQKTLDDEGGTPEGKKNHELVKEKVTKKK